MAGESSGGGDTRGQDPVVAVQVAKTLCAGGHSNNPLDENLVPVANAFDARQSDVIQYGDFTGPLDTCGSTIGVLTNNSTSYAIQAGALRTNPNSGPDGVGVQPDIAYTLEARAEVQAVAFSCKDYGADATVELAPTMRAMGHSESHANAGGQLAVCITGDITHTLKAEGFDASEDGTGRGQPIVAALYDDPRRFNGPHGGFEHGDLHPTLESTNPKQFAQIGMAVRRLMPIECERLQGFPDNYTAIPLPGRRKDDNGQPRIMADGPRYKALGNSWAVNKFRWLGERIDARLRAMLEKAA